MTEVILGIDVGTTAVKAILVSLDGTVLATTEAKQDFCVPRPGWAEQHPDAWWDSTKIAVSRALSLVDSVKVVSIGLSGQMHSSVFLDSCDKVIRPALLWNDGRTTSQCKKITEMLGFQGLRQTTCNLALEGFTASKVLWLRDNEPNHFARLRKLMLAKDYVRLKLTGETATEPSDASGTLLFDVRNRCWSTKVLSVLGIDSEVLPPIVGSTDISGKLRPDVARSLGLSPGIPVVGGGADNAAGAIGNGVIEQGMIQASIGTSGTMLMPQTTPNVDTRMSLHTFCHCLDNTWYLMGVILSAGSSLRWARDILNQNKTYDEMISETVRIQPGAEGLLFLPYLSGERTPHNDPNARGVFFGLHSTHSKAHLMRSVMEGICFAMKDSLELINGVVTGASSVRVTGGGARNAAWNQMQADIYGMTVEVIGSVGGAVYGAAVMGAVGVGVFKSIADATKNWVKVKYSLDPNPERNNVYNDLYVRYTKLYPAVKDRFEKV